MTVKTDLGQTSRPHLRPGQNLERRQGRGTEKVGRRRPAAVQHHQVGVMCQRSPRFRVQTMNTVQKATSRRSVTVPLCTTAPTVKLWAILEIVHWRVLRPQRVVDKEMFFCMSSLLLWQVSM